MKPIFISVFFLLLAIFSGSLYSQTNNWQWARSINGPSNEDEIDAVASDNNANVYISGKFLDSLYYAGSATPMVSEGMADIMLIKYDSTGTLLWAKQFGGLGEDNTFDAVCDLNDNIIISGYFQQTIQFDSITFTSFGGFDFFLVKLNPYGNVIWAKQYGGPGNDGGNEVATDYLNRILVCGDSDGPFNAGSFSFNNTGYKDSYILSLDQNGNENWIRSIQGAGTVQGKSVAVDDAGNVYFGGDYLGPNGAIDQLNTTHTFNVTSSRDAFITAWTPSGNYRWHKSWGGSGNDMCKGVATNHSGEVFIMGPFDHDVNLDGHIITIGPQVNFYLWQLDSMGNSIWTRHISSPSDVLEGGEMIEDGNNGIVFGLGMTDTLFLSSSNTPTELTLPSSIAYPVVVNYTETGDVAFTKQGDQSYYSTFGEISRSGNVIFLDSPFLGTSIFSSDTVSSSSNSNKDGAIVCIKIPTYHLNIQDEPDHHAGALKIYPNPSKTIIHIELDESYEYLMDKMSIIDITGKIIITGSITGYPGAIDIGTLCPGIYYLVVGSQVAPFIKQ